MKILAVGSHILPEPNKQSQVDHWRIGRPMRELAKHTDWEITHSPSFIEGFDKYKNTDEFTAEELEKAFAKISQYDIVFSSYHPDPSAFTLLKVARDKAGVQFIMDVDDDMFSINEDNPFWLKISDEQVFWMQRMIAHADWITTPSPVLADRFRQRRSEAADTVTVIPNYISDVYKHPSFDNSPAIVIGYCGGSSHYADLHESGAIEAIRQIMHENKQVRFKSVGMIVDKYIPKARFSFDGGKRGTDYLDKVFPSLNFDIGIAPLLDNTFNQGKSNIKWQEMTRAGAACVASNVGPYATLHNGVDALLVDNTVEAWYKGLSKLVGNIKLRNIILENARRNLSLHWRLENHWQAYKQLFERVTTKTHEQKPAILLR